MKLVVFLTALSTVCSFMPAAVREIKPSWNVFLLEAGCDSGELHPSRGSGCDEFIRI